MSLSKADMEDQYVIKSFIQTMCGKRKIKAIKTKCSLAKDAMNVIDCGTIDI